MSGFRDPRLARMAAFLGTIGIGMRAGAVDVPTLFPGSLIDRWRRRSAAAPTRRSSTPATAGRS